MMRLKSMTLTNLCTWAGCLTGVAIVCTFTPGVCAETKEVDVAVKTVVAGLNNPCGIAVQPNTGHVFVSDSGAGRVVSFDPAHPEKLADAITGFPKDVYGKGPMYDIGPLGLAFLDKRTLVVGGGGLPDGSELLRFYALPADHAPLSADQMKHQLGPIAAGEQSKSGEGNFYALAVTPNAIYVTCNGDDTKGWVSKAALSDGKPSSFEPFIATKVSTEVDAPVGIAISPRGHVVVGQMGEISKPQDSLLTFYSPTDGRMLMNIETGLFDIAGLAYSPSGRLYAVDYAWMDTGQGGLFRLDASVANGQQGVEAVKVLSLDKPTALAFAPDGTLFVTVFGTANEGSDAKPGAVLSIRGEL